MEEPFIRNSRGERLYTLVDGNEQADRTIVFVHGFFATLHENGYFDDLVADLSNEYRIVRFDLSGVGKSDGKPEDGNYTKWASDLDAVLSYVQSVYSGRVYLFAQSMGCFVASLLCPSGITKAIMTGTPNTSVSHIQKCMISYFGTRPGAHIDVNGFSVIPRKNGAVTRIGPSFWQVLSEFDPVPTMERFAKTTPTHIVHAGNDEVLGDQYIHEYDTLPGVTSETIAGDTHNFVGTDRRHYISACARKIFS